MAVDIRTTGRGSTPLNGGPKAHGVNGGPKAHGEPQSSGELQPQTSIRTSPEEDSFKHPRLWSWLSTAWKILRAWQPLTFRGLVALALAIFGIQAFALPTSDLIAYMVGGGVLTLLVLLLIGNLYTRYRLSKTLAAEARFDTREPTSGKPVDGGITLTGSHLPPYFQLKVVRQFRQPGVDSPAHLVFGGSPGKRHLIDQCIFPHRGLWNLESLCFELEDALGLTNLRWEIDIRTSVEVSAVTLPIKELPVVPSSSRSGDQFAQARERSGDPFDLKPYDPSDGVKRILWKTFARSGELIVRRPEPAIIPEGEIAVYLVARKHDDYVAGALQHYLERLEQDMVTVLFGTDQDSPDHSFLTLSRDIRAAINRSVWSPIAGSGKGFESFLEGLSQVHKTAHQVIVFGPASAGQVWVDHVLQVAGAHHVKTSFALVPEDVEPIQRSLARRSKNKRTANRPPLVRQTGVVRQTGAEVIICEAL